MSIIDKHKNMQRLKQFGIILLIIFAVIVSLSIAFFQTCNSVYCDFTFTNTLNIFIISCGIIGLTYCFFILRGFNETIDKGIMNDYRNILLDNDELDKDDNKEKLSCF